MYTDNRGFTMIELVVMMSIITAISAVTLVSFTGLNESGALNRSAQELALNIRKTQNSSLSVVEIQVGSPTPTLTLAPAIGLQLTTGQANYIMFADLDSPNPRDYKYDGLSEKIDPTLTLQGNIQISSMTTPNGNSYSQIHLIFTAPEANLNITDTNGNDLGNRIDIVLRAPTTGQTKTIIVRTSGQITIK